MRDLKEQYFVVHFNNNRHSTKYGSRLYFRTELARDSCHSHAHNKQRNIAHVYTLGLNKPRIRVIAMHTGTNLSSRRIFASECNSVQFWAFTSDCLDLRVPLAKLVLKKVNGAPRNPNSNGVKASIELNTRITTKSSQDTLSHWNSITKGIV